MRLGQMIYYREAGEDFVRPAIVNLVHSHDCVNCTVFAPTGETYLRSSVEVLALDGDALPPEGAANATTPPPVRGPDDEAEDGGPEPGPERPPLGSVEGGGPGATTAPPAEPQPGDPPGEQTPETE